MCQGGMRAWGERARLECHLVNFPTTSHCRGESATEKRDRTQEKSLRVKYFPLSEGPSSCLGLCAMEINRTALWWTVRQLLPHRVRPTVREESGLKESPRHGHRRVKLSFLLLEPSAEYTLTAGPISLGCAVRN